MSKPLSRLVIVTGWNAPKELWFGPIESLSSRFDEVLCLDCCEFERFEYFYEHIDGLLDTRTTFLGWSLGGQVLFQYLSQVSISKLELVEGLIVLQAPMRFVQQKDWAYGYPKTEFDSLFNLCERADYHRVDRVFAFLLLGGDIQARKDRALVKNAYIERGDRRPKYLLQGLVALRELDSEPALKALSLPILWIFGTADVLVDHSQSDCLNRYKNISVEKVDGMGHFPCGVNWKGLEQRITAFIDNSHG